jgi:hypothetical protein
MRRGAPARFVQSGGLDARLEQADLPSQQVEDAYPYVRIMR